MEKQTRKISKDFWLEITLRNDFKETLYIQGIHPKWYMIEAYIKHPNNAVWERQNTGVNRKLEMLPVKAGEEIKTVRREAIKNIGSSVMLTFLMAYTNNDNVALRILLDGFTIPHLIKSEQNDASNSDSAVTKPEYLTDANREHHRFVASTLSKHEKRQEYPCGPASCITKQDLADANRELHRAVISTLSKYEKLREHPYHAWGEVVEITEDDALPYNNVGWVKVVRYRIAVIHHPISSSHPDKSTPNCIVYSQGFRIDEKITRAFVVGERVALNGNIVKYPWEWGKDGRDAAEAVGSANEKKCKVEK